MPINKKNTWFVYDYKDAKGNKVSGEIEAPSLLLAKAKLRQQNILPNKIGKKPMSINLFSSAGSMQLSSEDIALISRQLSTLSAAGIPLVQSLKVLIDSTSKPNVINLISKLKFDLESGLSLSQAMGRHPSNFDILFCSLVAAGEQSGSLDTMLARIATYKEKTESLKRRIKKALYYPVAIIVIALGISALLLIKVVPTFKDLFKSFNAKLPDFTLFVLDISDLVQEHALRILILLIALVFLFRHSYIKFKPFRDTIQRLVLKFPIFGAILKSAIIARFARTLSTTFSAGVPLPEALNTIARTADNIVFYNAIQSIRIDVSNGQQLFTSMQKTNLFPPMAIQMIGIGEESGALEQMLTKLANIFEEEVDTKVDGLTTLLEPLIMVILGVLVGGLVIAMYLPIFKMGSVI
ncbi:MAG: type II secretion system F family protein [Gammaproteobacteria bacterium]